MQLRLVCSGSHTAKQHTDMRSHNNLLVTSLVLACLLHTVVPAKPILELVEGREGAMYNYTYHLPTDLNTQGCNGKVPVIFWLGGIGTFRRGAELVVDKSDDNGLGKLLVQDYPGPLAEARRQIISEQVVMVLPVPEYREDDQHYDPMILDVVFEDVLAKFGGIIDPDRIYYAGYSAGCRGGIRWAVHEPYRPAGVICAAGGAEMTPDPEKIVQLNLNAKSLEGRFFGWRLHWPDMPETFSKLNTLQNLPIYMVSGGSKDTVAYGTLDPEPEAALATFQALPNQALAHYINLNASHEAMSMEPYITVQTNTTDHVGVLEWLLQQRKAECKPARRFGRSLSVHRARRW